MAHANSSPLSLRHVLADEHEALRQLRLSSLAANPEAFGGTYEHAVSQPAEHWEWWAAQSESGDSQRTFVLVADDGRWVGLSLVRLDDDKPGSSILNAMWIAPEARGRGAAVSLCEACAAWATERGCHEMTLTVVVDNIQARRAYENARFVVTGKTTWERGGEILDELVMVRSL